MGVVAGPARHAADRRCPALPHAGPGAVPVNTGPPVVTGEPVYREPLRAEPGTWTSDTELAYSYRWLRDGRRIRGETDRRYRPQLRDLGSRLSVRVVATDEAGATARAASPSRPPGSAAPSWCCSERPGVSGTRRYTHRLTAGRADWQQPRVAASYRWLRDGRPIAGARHRRYRLTHLDVGHHVQVRVTARKEGYRTARTSSRRGRRRSATGSRCGGPRPTASRPAAGSPPAWRPSASRSPRRTPTRAAGAPPVSPSGAWPAVATSPSSSPRRPGCRASPRSAARSGAAGWAAT